MSLKASLKQFHKKKCGSCMHARLSDICNSSKMNIKGYSGALSNKLLSFLESLGFSKIFYLDSSLLI